MTWECEGIKSSILGQFKVQSGSLLCLQALQLYILLSSVLHLLNALLSAFLIVQAVIQTQKANTMTKHDSTFDWRLHSSAQFSKLGYSGQQAFTVRNRIFVANSQHTVHLWSRTVRFPTVSQPLCKLSKSYSQQMKHAGV